MAQAAPVEAQLAHLRPISWIEAERRSGGCRPGSAARRIKTFSESSDLAAEIRGLVLRADKVVFLGFGFHEQNIELLDVSDDIGTSEPIDKAVFATTMGMSPSDEGVVRAQIAHALMGRGYSDHESWIPTNNGRCVGLFNTY